MEQKKNPKGLIITLILTIVVLLGGLGYFGYDKYYINSCSNTNNQNSNQNNNQNNNQTDTDIIITTDMMNQTMNIFNSQYSISLFGYFYKANQLLVSNMDNKALLYMAVNKASIEGSNNTTIDQAKVDSAAKELFGKQITLNHETIVVDGETYTYDKNTQKYNVNYEGGKGGPVDFVSSTTSSIEKTEDSLSIIVTFAYIHFNDSSNGSNYEVYNSMDFTNVNKLGAFDLSNLEMKLKYGFESAIESKLPQYKFTYKSENGHPIFYSVEKVD